MTISYNVPNLNVIKNFSDPKSRDWLPGLFEEQYYNNLFPVDPTGNLTEKTEFSKLNSNVDDFTISLKRYFLFLYCLKSKPFLFENISRVINYDKDEFLFSSEIVEYISNIQTNKIKNQINSSLTIELVKKYIIDKGLDSNPQKLSEYFDIVNTEDYINTVSRTLSSVTYESIIKHTLYENLKSTSFNFKQGNATGWSDRAIKLSSGKFEYFIDTEGGPDNKSYPVVCVLTKRINKDSRENILKDSNDYISSVFAKKIGNECLARVIGKPGQLEDNYKFIPILKGRKDDLTYYNTICIVYDLSKIILSEDKFRNYDLQSLIEIGLGFFTEYTVEVKNIDFLLKRSESLSNFLLDSFPENAFSEVSYKISAKNKHTSEIYSRVNILSKGEIEATLSQPIQINRGNLISSFDSYIQSIINLYKEERQSSQYLLPFSQEDKNVYLHFDSFLNLLAITTLPNTKQKEETTKEFSPFDIEKFNSFDLDYEKDYISDEFYGKYLNLTKDLKNYSGRRVCVITKTLERILYNTFDNPSNSFYVTENLTSDKFIKKEVNLLSKINTTLPNSKFNYQKEDFFIDDSLVEKTVKIANLTTNYRENKYQSVALQTMAFYLINSLRGEELLKNDKDVKKFGEVFHYPILSAMAQEEINISLDIGEILNAPDFEVPQEILLVSSEIQKAFGFIRGRDYSLNDIVGGVNNYIISNVPCYSDIVNLINAFQNIDNTKDLVYLVIDLLIKLPLEEILSWALEKLLNKLGVLGEQKDPCKPLPSRFSFNPDDVFNSIEYMKDLYSRTLNPEGLVQGFLEELPKLGTLDFWLKLAEKIFFYILKIAVDFLLRELFSYIREYLEKACALDFPEIKPPYFEENQPEDLFTPNILADSFGSPAGSDGPLYDVQLSIDINVLIDISEIFPRDYVYNKFAEEFSIEKNEENFQEISRFLSDISPAIDLYELASLLRQVATEYTLTTLSDSIKITDFKFKNLFLEKDDIINLFKFLGKYCDYRICYDILSKSLQKYVGNICGPQQSRKKEYELTLKNSVGDDYKNVIRDQIIDLEKEFDKLCSTSLTVSFDLLKDGPKLLASSLTPYMVMPFATIVDFQRNIYEYEKGQNVTPKQLEFLKSSGLIFEDSELDQIYKIYDSSLGEIKSKYPNAGGVKVKPAPPEKVADTLTDAQYIKDFNFRKDQINSYLIKNNITVNQKNIEKKIKSELIIDPIKKSDLVYASLGNRKKFGDAYKNIVYSVDYLQQLRDEIQEQIENSTNIDMQDDMELFMSYIDKLNVSKSKG